ncbi:MFS transporter [Nocardia mexicana]|uniref:DHA2 family multidrug resistance protein-like MFS transporter n=1 Tax=Nocardia mexicana TaxID=279262 RepID=A0A370H1E3_9NOCA|nr:MFS transporter [Nocardia mexicana]RDI49343.1 DHA2 family multidrug resistance protein-like MFS transporter [Nocardia mexicana]
MTALDTPQAQVWPVRVRGRSDRRALALGVLALLSGLLGGDTVIHVVAVPRASEYFAMGSGIAWLAAGMGAIALSACLLGAGTLGDRLGRRRILLGGTSAVVVGAFVATYASDSTTFLIGRVITGAGLAACFVTALAIVAALYPPEDLPRAFGVWLGLQSVAIMAAGVVGSALVDGTTWRTGYLITGVIAALLLALGWLTVPDSKAATPRRFDGVGVLLGSAALAALVGGVYGAADRGWTDPLAASVLAAAVVLLVLFARRELRTAEPAVPVRLLTSAPFAATWSTGMLAGFAAAVVVLQTITALHGHRGLSVSMVMVVAVPLYLGMVLGADLAAQAQERGWSARTLYVSGLICCGVGILALAGVGANAELWVYSAVCAVAGFGVMWAQNPQSAVLMSSLPADMSGVLAAVKTAAGQLGFVLGLAAAVSVVDTFRFTVGMVVIGTLLLAGALVIAVLLRPWGFRTANTRDTGTAEA